MMTNERSKNSVVSASMRSSSSISVKHIGGGKISNGEIQVAETNISGHTKQDFSSDLEEAADGEIQATDTNKSSERCHSADLEQAVVDDESTSRPKRFSMEPVSSRTCSSLTLRLQPVDILLRPEMRSAASLRSLEVTNSTETAQKIRKGLLPRLCMRPEYSLRKQMMLTFGSINAVTTIVVVACCIIFAVFAGEQARSSSEGNIQDAVEDVAGDIAVYLGENFDHRFMLYDIVHTIEEATMDRFEGYPNKADDNVPFLDMYTNSRMYPIDSTEMKLLALDWAVVPNANESNKDEHFQERWGFYASLNASTSYGSFHFQGSCNPDAKDPNTSGYYKNCTTMNSEILAGGVVEARESTEQIYRQGSDLVPLLKAIFEANSDIRDLGLYFANNGYGATINFPAYSLNRTQVYTSIGCEWMNTSNPYDNSTTIGSQEMIDRCQENGKEVDVGMYNPLERGWLRDQASDPDPSKVHVQVYEDAWANGEWLLTLGKPIYDRLTKEFLACIYVGISLNTIEQTLKNLGEELNDLRDEESSTDAIITAVQWNKDGTIIASSLETLSGKNPSIYEAKLGVNKTYYDDLYAAEDFAHKLKECRTHSEDFVSFCYPVPSIPAEHDRSYQPHIVIFVSTSIKDMNSLIEKRMSDPMKATIQQLSFIIIALGFTGLIIMTIFIMMMSYILTSPLTSMNRIASDIVDNFGDPTKNTLIKQTKQTTKEVRCAFKTEINEVVQEFNKMVESFSGSFKTKVEKIKSEEVCNIFREHEEFLDLYENRRKEEFKYKVDKISPYQTVLNDDDSSKGRDYIHIGSNLRFCEANNSSSSLKSLPQAKKRRILSPIFLWTVALIVLPPLIFNVTILVLTVTRLYDDFDSHFTPLKDFFLEKQMQALSFKTSIRSSSVAKVAGKGVNDLYLLTRYSEWLLFGGLHRADTFTQVTSGVERCKTDLNPEDCEYFKENYICDCKWNDNRTQEVWNDNKTQESCGSYPDGSRHLQVPFFALQKNGGLSFPNSSFSRETTSWWENATMLPGSDENLPASRYSSSYVRLRSVSSIPIVQVTYNADVEKRYFMGAFIAFEADGLMYGYEGCSSAYHVTYANFTLDNKKAAEVRPKLCQLGKYGYDPR